MILYIIRWTFIYILLIYLLHNLYLFFQDNLTTTKNKDFYNNISIEPIHTNSGETNNANPNINPNLNPNISKDLNSDFTYQMKYELNDFINKIKV
jgi:hypothetical protein